MIPVFNFDKANFKFLTDQPPQIFADFCKLAGHYLNKGANFKLYQAASQKLEVDSKQIQSVVEGLAFLFIEASKYEFNKEEFREAVQSLGLPETACPIIYDEYLSQLSTLENALPQAAVQNLQFINLEWRFEAQVSSRCLKNQIKPRIILKLDLEKEGEAESFCLQSDIPNIIHMSQMISQALQESRTHHSKRIQRAVA